MERYIDSFSEYELVEFVEYVLKVIVEDKKSEYMNFADIVDYALARGFLDMDKDGNLNYQE